jgi:hypothetical protein
LSHATKRRRFGCAAREDAWPLKAGDLKPWKDVRTAAPALRGHGTRLDPAYRRKTA